MTDTPASVVFDASAYRSLAATADPDAARAIGRHLADAERARGVRAAASPYVLWELLATAMPKGTDAAGDAPPERDTIARDAVARAALAACVAHCAREGDGAAPPADAPAAEAPPRRFALADDPDVALCHAVTGSVPPELTAWGEYLSSLADEVAQEPAAARAARLAGPLRHVRDRARQAAEDFADEVQDAVAAAYDAAAPGWDPSADAGARQRALTGSADPAAGPGTDADDDTGGALLGAVLAGDPLLRAVAVGRARRARRLAAGKGAHAEAFDDTVDDALLADAARVVERFPSGVALFRELIRRVIAGELDLATRGGRRWFWDAQVAFAAAGRVVSGNATVVAAAVAAAAADPGTPAAPTRTIEQHVTALGAPAGGR
jgi:hypothetical protein